MPSVLRKTMRKRKRFLRSVANLRNRESENLRVYLNLLLEHRHLGDGDGVALHVPAISTL
jgi:hypothetical protein